MGRYDDRWGEQPTVAERRAAAEAEIRELTAKGQLLEPVKIVEKAIATTFWGKSWCQNLEKYSDYESRLPRGRSYVRHGAVIDLKISKGGIKALVSGSEIYGVNITICKVGDDEWQKLCADCGGAIDSMVELLQGKFSTQVMARMCEPKVGLFPSPKEIRFRCTCPDWANMCKHIAAVLYGVGARLDHKPELLFELRQVNASDLVRAATKAVVNTKTAPKGDKHLVADDLASLFGVELGAMDAKEAVQNTHVAAPKPLPKVTKPNAKKAVAPAASVAVEISEPIAAPTKRKETQTKPAVKAASTKKKMVAKPAPTLKKTTRRTGVKPEAGVF